MVWPTEYDKPSGEVVYQQNSCPNQLYHSIFALRTKVKEKVNE